MKRLTVCAIALLAALSLCGCFGQFSREYTTRITVNSDPQGAVFRLDSADFRIGVDGEPGEEVATTPFAMNVRVRVFGSGLDGDQHSKVWGSAGTARALWCDWGADKGHVYRLVLSGFLAKEGYEQLRLYKPGYYKRTDFHFTAPYQEIAKLSNKKPPPSHITVTIPLILATGAPSPTARGEQPQELVISYDRADAIPPRTGTLAVTSDPEGASVFVDDKLTGATPCTLSLLDGFYDVRVTSDEAGEYRETVRVLAGTEVTVQASPAPKPE